MKIFCAISLIIFSIFSCAEKGSTPAIDDKVTSITLDSVTLDTIVDSGKWSMSAGKKLSEIDFLNNPIIKKRLKNLLGQEFDIMLENWTQEGGIVVSDNILMGSGCSKDNCIGNQYIILYDLTYNNLNVINFRQNRIKSYEENGIIGMPSEVQTAFDAIYAKQMGAE